jgi:hydrogenase-1 operon protein HyaF
MNPPGKNLQAIAVRVESPEDYSVGNISALLAEIATQLEKFIATGESAEIDLKSLPLGPLEYEQLRLTLGQGEVAANLEAIGPSEIIETKFPGVWWVTHYNVEGDIVADLIEIARIPSLLQSQPDDMQAGLARLQMMLKEQA